MRLLLALGLSLFSASAFSKTVPWVTIADSINPGTGDLIISAIDQADHEAAAYLVLQLDTPGGLLSTTRQIVQHMLNAKTPIVVYVGPRGAQAGSAGALITFAADVAVMAPGTNIGAAHPVIPGEKTDDTMKEKMANDTAAFAESLARTKGRNVEWAAKAVRKSASIAADEALKLGVVDLMAEDGNDLLKKLGGHKLKTAKGAVTVLPDEPQTASPVKPTIKHRVVSFFADPQVAYLIMSLGAIAIWIELSHPGLIAPGVIGAICICLSLVSFQMLPIDYGALALIFVGLAMLVAELFVPSFGVLGLGGIACFIFGSLFLMDTNAPELRLSLAVILPTAAVMAGFLVVLSFVLVKSRKAKLRSQTDTLVGEFGEVRDLVTSKSGTIFVQGELWSATTTEGKELRVGSLVEVVAVHGLKLTVREASRPS